MFYRNCKHGIRSFELNFEINAFMYSSQVAKKQRAIFENDILKSKEIH